MVAETQRSQSALILSKDFDLSDPVESGYVPTMMETDPTPDTPSELPVLSPCEIRVLGCLLEKERLTPEYYPMTLKAIVQACNQKTSRDPVTDYDEDEVSHALDALQARRLVSWVHQAGARTRKFRQHADREFYLDDAEAAVLCVLLLRGAQTVGEIRARTERMHAFDALTAVEGAIRELCEKPEPLARALPRIPGRKETRFMHLLAGDSAERPESGVPASESDATVASLPQQWQQQIDEAHGSMRAEIDALKAQLADLREEFDAFRKEFE